jgi:hypothetical protein
MSRYGYVFGNNPTADYIELCCVTKYCSMIILCPGTSESEQIAHSFLTSAGFEWSIFQEPGNIRINR